MKSFVSIATKEAKRKLFQPTIRCLATQPLVFNDDLKQKHRAYAAQVALDTDFEYEYIRDAVADTLVDRVNDIMMDFPIVLDLGCNTGNIAASFARASRSEGRVPGGLKSLTMLDPNLEMINAARKRIELNKTGLENIDMKFSQSSLETFCPHSVPKDSIDLVMSSMSMHWANDLHHTLAGIMNCLKPDGAFIGAMLGDDTLFELRTSLAIAQQERKGGLSPHVSPMLPSADACALLNKAGFNLQTVDNATIGVSFENMFSLMEHLSSMGESNANVSTTTGERMPLDRDTLLAACAVYQHLFGETDGSSPAQFQVIYMIGWKPDTTQPKPLDRGIADVSLGDLGKLGQSAIVRNVGNNE